MTFPEVLVEDPENAGSQRGDQSDCKPLSGKKPKLKWMRNLWSCQAFVAAAVQVSAEHPGIADLQKLISVAEEAEANKLLEADNKKLAELDKARKLRELEAKRRQDQISGYLSKAEQALQAGSLTRPLGNALEFF